MKNTEKFRGKKNSAIFSVFLSRIRVENTEKFREKKKNTEKCTKGMYWKNLQTKNTENCTKRNYTEKFTAKKYRKMYKKVYWKNSQTRNSLDFSGLFLGPEKQRKSEKKFPGKKKIL